MTKHRDTEPYLNAAERELLRQVEAGEWKRPEDETALCDKLETLASKALRKSQRVNVRLTLGDLVAIKQRAAAEGMPYQTLITSVLHKYVTDQWVDKRAVAVALASRD